MRKRMCFFLLAGGMLMALSIASFGQQSAPALPNTPTPHVTTRLKAVPLQETLKELSRLTGVRMTASADTADLKVTVLVNDLPLDIVQARLAETLHLTWAAQETGKDKPTSYLLSRSTHDKDEEQELRAKGESAFRKGIDEAIGVLALAPADRKKLFADRKALESTFFNKTGEVGVRLLSYLTPTQRTDIMDGNRLVFPIGQPPAELAPHIDEILKAFFAATPDDAFAQTLQQPERQFTIERIGEGAGSRIRVTFSAQGAKGSASAGMEVAGVRPEEVYRDAYFPDHTGADYADARQPVNLTTSLTAESLPELLQKAANTLHINIIGESYREYVPKHGKPVAVYSSSVPAGPSSVEKALNGMLTRDYWWKQGSVYLFQRPQWWAVRRADVTDATSAYLTAVLKRQPLTFEDGAEVCKTLNADQWGWMNSRFFADSRYLTPVQNVLRFYGSLPPARKADLFRENGTDTTTLSEVDQMRLRTWIAETGKEALQKIRNTPGKIQITAKRATADTQFSPVRFSAVFLAKDGTTTLLREQVVVVSDPSEVRISSED
ncbi:MAG: hypothetical protein JWL77_706 [Chthonomonadaceae bacterium]|nr:hypothetical protein [Chthonomonadaceae bacterium]